MNKKRLLVYELNNNKISIDKAIEHFCNNHWDNIRYYEGLTCLDTGSYYEYQFKLVDGIHTYITSIEKDNNFSGIRIYRIVIE